MRADPLMCGSLADPLDGVPSTSSSPDEKKKKTKQINNHIHHNTSVGQFIELTS